MHQLDATDLEGIARDVHDATGGIVPVDAFDLATACGLTLRATPGANSGIDLEAMVIRYPARSRAVRQHGAIAHELGHWALWQAEEDHRVERHARYLAGALMLPREAFRRDVYTCDWDLDAIRGRHPNVSAEMTVVRMTQVSDACAWVWDDGAVRRRYGTSDDEGVDAIVDRVIRESAPVHDGDVHGWPLLEPGHRRVIVVRAAA